VDVNRGRSDFPGAGRETNAEAGAVPRRLTDYRHLNQYERHGFKFLVPICSAARMGNVEMVKTLLECDKITNVEWALHWAAIMGHHHVVLELLNSKREVDVNKEFYNMKDPILRDLWSTGSNVFSPLHIASFYGHVRVVKALCEDRLRRLRANTASEGGVTAVQMAAEMGHVQIVKILLERAEVQIAWALHGAAKKGHDDVVKELLNSEKEVDVNALKQEILDDAQDRSSFGEEFNPLHLASIYGHASVVQVLCEDRKRRLQVNIESKPAGLTALQMAVENGHAEVVMMLLEKRRWVEIRWALHTAAKMGHPNVVLELLKSGKEVYVNTLHHEILDDAKDFGEEFNPLHLASIYGHAPVVKVLCEDKRGRLKVNTENDKGMTALHMAMERGHADIGKMLLERPEVETRRTLYKAVKLGHHDWVRMLLESGKEMDVNKLEQEILDDERDRKSFGEEFNPLHLASIYGHVGVVQVLCEQKTLQANTESGAGVTAVQIAIRAGNAEIEKILLDRTEVQQHLDRLYRDRQLHVDAANAILVGATLIASVTFAAWLQPPLGYSEFYGSTSIDVGAPLPSGMYPSFVSVAGHPILDIFWIFNSMSFVFAIATLMVGANAARPPRQDKYIGEVVRTLRTLLSLAYSLLTVSVGCVLGAFATAGFVVLPPV
jgi:ankyrin repeat protein